MKTNMRQWCSAQARRYASHWTKWFSTIDLRDGTPSTPALTLWTLLITWYSYTSTGHFSRQLTNLSPFMANIGLLPHYKSDLSIKIPVTNGSIITQVCCASLANVFISFTVLSCPTAQYFCQKNLRKQVNHHFPYHTPRQIQLVLCSCWMQTLRKYAFCCAVLLGNTVPYSQPHLVDNIIYVG